MSQTNTTYKNFADFLKTARKLGENAGRGAIAAPEFLIQLALAATEGQVNPTQGKEEDQPGAAWKAFAESAEKAVSGKDASNVKNRMSDCRTLVKVARIPDVDLPDTLTEVRKVLSEASKHGLKAGAWDGMMKVVRAQGKQETRLDRDEWMAVLRGEEKKEKTEVDVLKALAKQVEGIINGKEPSDANPEGKPGFPSDELEEALSLINQRINLLEISAKMPGVAIADIKKMLGR